MTRMFERLTKAFSHFCVRINERFVSKSFSSYTVNLNSVIVQIILMLMDCFHKFTVLFADITT